MRAENPWILFQEIADAKLKIYCYIDVITARTIFSKKKVWLFLVFAKLKLNTEPAGFYSISKFQAVFEDIASNISEKKAIFAPEKYLKLGLKRL